jgi:hypothetical protein
MVAVQYLHRTIADYVESPQVWQRLLSYTAGSNFEPSESPLKSLILELKKSQLSIKSNSQYFAKEQWDNAMPFVNHDEPMGCNKQVTLLNKLDRILMECMVIDKLHRRDTSFTQYWSSYKFSAVWNTDMLAMTTNQ